ncbi:MAG TPA: imidazole glycerol phosphate synthase subunit HisH [Vicinamibacterales bacterium]|nr:imidazole glycerol phosphate synthase subunit HisH [Vicinamibacterales bacterium]
MITIVDYGVGNIRAFLNVYRRLNIEARAVTTADELAGASKVILPGVGSFDHAMERLARSGMRDVLDDLALRQRVPVLGVCVGMQMLGRASDEGRLPGLGWIDGRVKALAARPEKLPVPHMGWNDVRPVAKTRLFDQLESGARFYFLHSYYFVCDRDRDQLAVADYGGDFACAAGAGNVFGVQFHPEKSHHYGARLLQNFAEL